jgi:hypothetical protein
MRLTAIKLSRRFLGMTKILAFVREQLEEITTKGFQRF